MPGKFQASKEDRCSPSLLRIQVLVPRTQGQSVVFPHDRLDDELDIKIQVLNHATQDDSLLCILLPEHSAMGPNNIEKLEDHCSDTTEMPRPRNTTESGTEVIHRHKGSITFRIDF